MDNKLLALAVIPGVLIVVFVYIKDKVEKEPIGLIIKCLIFGAISAFLAMIAESAAGSVLPEYDQGTAGYAFVNGILLAAFWEELLKYLMLRIGTWKNQHFNYRFDGIVYGTSVAVGFAILENIGYVSMYGLETALVRAVTAVPLHAFCGVFMGVFYAMSKKNAILGKGVKKTWYTFLALIIPMIIHGNYDFLAMYAEEWTNYVFLGLVVIMYIAAIRTINGCSRADYRAGFYPEARTIVYSQDIDA